jgi:hypothetical protein
VWTGVRRVDPSQAGFLHRSPGLCGSLTVVAGVGMSSYRPMQSGRQQSSWRLQIVKEEFVRFVIDHIQDWAHGEPFAHCGRACMNMHVDGI